MAKKENKPVIQLVKIALGRQTPVPQNTASSSKPKENNNGKAK